MGKKIGILIKFIIFNAILVICLLAANKVLRNKEYEGCQDMFVKWKPAHADIVFIGNSHQFCTIDTDLLYSDYGIESYMLASSAQTVPMSYYAAMEAIELRQPDVICFEVSYCANDFMTVEGMDHCFFDGFPRCEARKEALEDLIDPEDRIYYLLPIGLFHSRWKDLTEADYSGFPVSERGTYHQNTLYINQDIPVVEKDEIYPMPGEMERYLRMLIELCEEKNVKLILYAAPFNGMFPGEEGSMQDLGMRQRIFNHVGVVAEEYGVEYHNLFYEIDAIGINNETDWADSQHFNIFGQYRLTKYMMESGYLGY